MKISRISMGTVGSLRCEVALNELLCAEDNSKITRPVMSRLVKHREGLREIVDSDIRRHFKIKLLLVWKRNMLASVESINSDLVSEKIRSHLRCCMNAHYQIELNRIQDELEEPCQK